MKVNLYLLYLFFNFLFYFLEIFFNYELSNSLNNNYYNSNDNYSPMKNLIKDFKKLLIQHKDIIYHYFKYSSIKSRNFQNKNEELEKGIKKKDSTLNKNQSNNFNLFNNANFSTSISKSEYINNYNKNFYSLINKNTSKLEFNFSFGANLIQSVCFCENCNKPNTIWDIRKEFQFSKNKRETKTRCKFCEKYYIPYFLVIEEISENNNINNNNLSERRDKRKINVQTNQTNFNGIYNNLYN
jgi:hypothetical protein